MAPRDITRFFKPEKNTQFKPCTFSLLTEYFRITQFTFFSCSVEHCDFAKKNDFKWNAKCRRVRTVIEFDKRAFIACEIESRGGNSKILFLCCPFYLFLNGKFKWAVAFRLIFPISFFRPTETYVTSSSFQFKNRALGISSWISHSLYLFATNFRQYDVDSSNIIHFGRIAFILEKKNNLARHDRLIYTHTHTWAQSSLPKSSTDSTVISFSRVECGCYGDYVALTTCNSNTLTFFILFIIVETSSFDQTTIKIYVHKSIAQWLSSEKWQQKSVSPRCSPCISEVKIACMLVMSFICASVFSTNGLENKRVKWWK